MLYVLSLISALIVGCTAEKNAENTVSPSTCKGIYYERISGELKKFNQYDHKGQCLTENMKLSQFETTQEKWNKNDVKCVPQSGFTSKTLVAANNYYDLRDGKAFLQFDASTGVFRRIILAEDKEGKPVYTKLQGCFFQRTGIGIDSQFGKMLLLDTDVSKLITSQYFDAMEIFTYTEAGNDVNMLRFDDTKDYDYRNCPYLNTPWKFCEKLRDGNEMYFPVLPLADQIALRDEAIIISIQFNWTLSSKSAFDSMWDNVALTRREEIREGYMYDVVHIPDVPRYIDQSWKSYVMNQRPFMPDVNSNTSINLCYKGSKYVTMGDGSKGKVFGEVCYVDGNYSFTQ